MKRGSISLALCLALLMCLLLPASAAGTTDFLRGGYEIADRDLLLYGKPVPSGGTLTVSADAQTLDAFLTTVGEIRSPVTIYCLVDASTALSKEQQQQQEDILLNISSRMGDNDNMVIATFDEKMVEGWLTSDTDVINTTAKTIGRRIWTKNLYEAVTQAVASLETNTQFHKDKLLLILSDGNDCGRSDVTLEKAAAAIEKTTIPVYSIAITGTYMNTDAAANAKHLRSLSEASMGGMCIIPAEEKISAANAAEMVWQNIQAGSLILVNLESIQDTNRDITLRVRYETEKERLEDTVTIYAVDLPKKSTLPETVPMPGTQEPDEGPQEDQPQNVSVPVWVWIAAGLLLVAAAVGIIALLGKKKASAVPPAEQAEPSQEVAADDFRRENTTQPIQPLDFTDPAEEMTQPVTSLPGSCRLDFVALMHPDVHFSFELPPHSPATFGRDSRSRFVLNENDAKLSGVHFEAEWDEKKLYLRDKNSTNGTKLNGGLCKPGSWLQMESGSILGVGGYEYRVSVSTIEN